MYQISYTASLKDDKLPARIAERVFTLEKTLELLTSNHHYNEWLTEYNKLHREADILNEKYTRNSDSDIEFKLRDLEDRLSDLQYLINVRRGLARTPTLQVKPTLQLSPQAQYNLDQARRVLNAPDFDLLTPQEVQETYRELISRRGVTKEQIAEILRQRGQ